MNIHDVPAHPALALAAIRLSLPDDAPASAIRAAIGDHIEALIDYLDAIEPDADLEETEEEQTLAWHESVDQSLIALAPIGPEDDELELDCDSIESDTLDEHGEEDRADAEPDLGWCNNVSQLRLDVGGSYGDGDSTAPERHGAGFIRCAPDDCEDSHDAEAVNEDGSDTGDSDNGLGDEDGANERGILCGPPMFPEAWSSDWTGGLWKQPEGAHPKSVVMRADGTCMLPRIRDGARIVAEPVQPKAGEIAILFIEGVPKPQVKLLIADIPPAHRPDALVEFHMLNPPTRFCIPRHRLRGAWRFHSVIEESARL